MSRFIKALVFLVGIQIMISFAMAQTPAAVESYPIYRQGVREDGNGKAIVKTIPAENEKMSTPSKVLLNPVGFQSLDVQVGEVVVIRPRTHSQINPLEEAQVRYMHEIDSGRRGGESLPGTPYYEYRIVRTWEEDAKLTQAQKFDRFVKQGIRPLRRYEVELGPKFSNTHESIYHIGELALQNRVSSKFFEVGDRVFFIEKVRGNEAYREGVIEALYANGDVVVKQGLKLSRMRPENVFNQDRRYEGLNHFAPGEETSLRYQPPASNITTIETLKVLAVSATGEILAFLKKTNSIMRINFCTRYFAG